MTGAPNILLVVLDALREDAIGNRLEVADRCLRAARCVASAPWTLPSCSSILRGVDARHHTHFWREPALPANRLLDALPDDYRTVGIVNNGAINAGSGAELGFDRWIYTRDHDEPFRRALRLIRRTRRRHPLFLLLHSNIVHDYCLPVADRYRSAGSPPVLGDRVISWRDTTDEDRAAAATTYAACVQAQLDRVEEVLQAVRDRDDFVTIVTSDHGEGFDYDQARVHHGGRVNQDLLHVPFFVDLPSSTPVTVRQGVADALDTQVISGVDVVPTLLDLAGITNLPEVDGVPVRRIGARTLVSEDRRYLYLNDRFRLNFRGFHKHMSDEDLERNRQTLDLLSGGPHVRSFLRHPDKLIVTAIGFRDGGQPTPPAAQVEFGHRLLGSPALARQPHALFAFERYDLAADPAETHNLCQGTPDWAEALLDAGWGQGASMPGADGREVALAAILADSQVTGA